MQEPFYTSRLEYNLKDSLKSLNEKVNYRIKSINNWWKKLTKWEKTGIILLGSGIGTLFASYLGTRYYDKIIAEVSDKIYFLDFGDPFYNHLSRQIKHLDYIRGMIRNGVNIGSSFIVHSSVILVTETDEKFKKLHQKNPR